ncbi:MAG: hypothetical protein ACKOAH_19745, partial [Pirellula sp.]
MSDKTPEQLATECEGLELIDDLGASVALIESEFQDAHLELADCKRNARHARRIYFRAWIQNLRHGIAQQLSGLIGGVPLWPIAVVYVLSSAVGLLLLRISLQAVPFLSEYLVTI